jgi:hypothetical protein
MSAVMRWEEPTVLQKQQAEKWRAVADELRRNPQKWAVVAEAAATGTGAVSTGIKRATGVYAEAFAPAGTFEATTRTTKPGVVAVYARYVGEPS